MPRVPSSAERPDLPTALLERPEQATAWDLRGRWAANRKVVLTLSGRCIIQRLEGHVEYVAVTGAYVIADGWHIPTVDVLGIADAHFSQRDDTKSSSTSSGKDAGTPGAMT